MFISGTWWTPVRGHGGQVRTSLLSYPNKTLLLSHALNKSLLSMTRAPLEEQKCGKRDTLLRERIRELTSKVSTMSPNTCPRCLQSEHSHRERGVDPSPSTQGDERGHRMTNRGVIPTPFVIPPTRHSLSIHPPFVILSEAKNLPNKIPCAPNPDFSNTLSRSCLLSRIRRHSCLTHRGRLLLV